MFEEDLIKELRKMLGQDNFETIMVNGTCKPAEHHWL